MMVKFCGKCGNRLNDGARFCPNCGAAQEIKRQQSELLKGNVDDKSRDDLDENKYSSNKNNTENIQKQATERLERERKIEKGRLVVEYNKKRRNIIILIAISIVIVAISIFFVVTQVVIPQKRISQFKSQIPNAQDGSSVRFGSYNSQDIEWVVLAYEEKKALLICKNVLFKKQYNEEIENTTWADCSLRAYLNGEFYNNCFNTDEQAKIATTHVINSNNAQHSAAGEVDTDDKVFLLSIDEAKQYFKSNEDRKAKDTKGEKSWWWLRSPGDNSDEAASVGYDGGIDDYENLVNYDLGVRPALWVNYES